jgi:hypothetical protein
MFRASDVWKAAKGLLMRLKISIALLLALAPSLAFAKPRTATAHMHPQLYRDRAPKVRTREIRSRQTQGSTSKAAPVAQQPDSF